MCVFVFVCNRHLQGILETASPPFSVATHSTRLSRHHHHSSLPAHLHARCLGPCSSQPHFSGLLETPPPQTPFRQPTLPRRGCRDPAPLDIATCSGHSEAPVPWPGPSWRSAPGLSRSSRDLPTAAPHLPLDMVADASRSARTSSSASPPGTWMAGLGRSFACWAPLILLRAAAAITVSAASLRGC